MKVLAIVLALYTPLMLLIHLSTGKILKDWNRHPDSWISRWFPPLRALRVEGVFWLLALAAWSLWRPLAWKIMIVAFAAIHLAIWAVEELGGKAKGLSAFNVVPKMERSIVVFDLVEAVILMAVGLVAVTYLTHAS
ncbi:MAG TPA: hypothetical protein VFC10_01870 [Terriglobia bacterium]|jgi:hypothetical protein|nr:hypothetical protein [Terriglobia bacterium]